MNETDTHTTGLEAVDWLVKKLNIAREEAMAIGELLLQMGIIAHVCRSEHFEDKYFFYRFVEDEVRDIYYITSTVRKETNALVVITTG